MIEGNAITCLKTCNIGSAGTNYSVTLRFESEEDKELFDSYGNDLMRIIMSENPLSKIKHELI